MGQNNPTRMHAVCCSSGQGRGRLSVMDCRTGGLACRSRPTARGWGSGSELSWGHITIFSSSPAQTKLLTYTRYVSIYCMYVCMYVRPVSGRFLHRGGEIRSFEINVWSPLCTKYSGRISITPSRQIHEPWYLTRSLCAAHTR